MRLRRPTWSSLSVLISSRRLLGLVTIAVLAVSVIVGVIYYRNHRPSVSQNLSENADDATIRQLKKSNNIIDKRSVISAYMGKGDYEAALNLAQTVASLTNTYQDYMTVLSICSIRQVNNKDACIKKVASQLKPLIGSMPFNSAYSAGAYLEKNDYKKDAVDFYKRAYDVYSPDPQAENMMSQEQLNNRINELLK